MKNLKVLGMASALALSLALLGGASNASAQTGSRIGVTTSPTTTIWMGPPGELVEIRELLQAGETEKAISVAETFLAYVESDASEAGSFYRYYALNALCAAFSTDGQLDVAVSRCDAAIGLYPNRWEAINSRGTVHYFAGRYDQAAEDYRRALELESSSGDATTILQHNLELAESQLAGS